ncbi:hypothetical protein HBI81_034510 [Parastagonospora nodorum]|nr:hypothetical protein HBH52_077300 [Parastagonospora nodorum]KAH4007657.1 hypothetical protein HBI10_004950 [Parastagonospora nodorum]KAH4023337.1 hypothetical protein HBI13_086660 [Parastagonospora nodorum]KAH4058415.1 hypothetical protein HBH49_032740 [Parastagonospora nodorum]KAH4271350.1 hypothetical protein HBI03_035650 [Parastagonospora nodorum]
MDTFKSSTTTTIERPNDKRLRMPWGKKTISLKNSVLFNKPNHSEEWHQAIDAAAGVLHPSDPKFPYGLLREQTEVYLKKKGKISQPDADIRLAILITSHEARDVAVAAAAHAITAKSLRALLHADLNVMQGSYWGLKMWLQCLIAANDGSSASVTDLEALWARKLLPFATKGQRAAEWFLAGVCHILREMALPNMDIVPEFAILASRAITDYATQLEGLRLKNDWAAAYESVLWMVELARTSPITTPPGHLLPEHILDSQFPVWRLWTYWKPNVQRIRHLASCDCEKLTLVSDLVALEGPDMITGQANTLRDGLVARYDGIKNFLQWRGIIVEVPNRTRESIGRVLERVACLLELGANDSGLGHVEKMLFFRDFLVARPITTKRMDIFEATCKIPYKPENNLYDAILQVWDNRDRLGGQHVIHIHSLLSVMEDASAEDLCNVTWEDWLRLGIENCMEECREAVCAHIDDGSSWTDLFLEYRAFGRTVNALRQFWPNRNEIIMPVMDGIESIVEIYKAVKAELSKPRKTMAVSHIRTADTKNTTKEASGLSFLVGEDETRHPLESYIEVFCRDRVLGREPMATPGESIIDALMQVWRSTSKPNIDLDRRKLAINVAGSAVVDSSLCGRCLTNVESTGLPDTSVEKLSDVMHKANGSMSEAIIDLTNLLSNGERWALCWFDLLELWLEGQTKASVFEEEEALEYSLRTMGIAQWIEFMQRIQTIFCPVQRHFRGSAVPRIPRILQPAHLSWITTLSKYTSTLIAFEGVAGIGSEAMRCIQTNHIWYTQTEIILECLRKVEGKRVEALMLKVVCKLKLNEHSILSVKECLDDLLKASPEAVEICYRIWDAKHEGLDIPGLPSKHIVTQKAVLVSAVSNEPDQSSTKASLAASVTVSRRAIPIAVAEIMIAGWIQSDDINENDKTAISSLAGILEMCVEWFSDETWTMKLKEATRFWEDIENEIIAEATRLEGLTKSMRKRDPKGTALLLQELGLPNNSQLDREMDDLPPGFIDIVERVGEDEAEINFPLNHFTDLQREAMGIPAGANTFLLRLVFPSTHSELFEFCVHFNTDKDLDTLDHTTCSTDARTTRMNVCKTSQSAFTWQLQSIIYTQIQIGNVNIADLHKRLKEKMSCLGQSCVACDVSLQASPKAQIKRSVPCDMVGCARLWYALPLDVRIPELRADIYVVDLMLTSVYAAALTGRTELLPACPIRNLEHVKTILNSLPSLKLISHAVNVSAVLRSYHKDAELLISWACVHHRGYIASATGLCKVPTMPAGTHQFVLANARPKLESDFISRMTWTGRKSDVLFHGTTLDRLPAILAQGLKVCSGTSLQRTGAAHGKGIYMAEDPSTSLAYASPSLSWRNSGLANMKLLLGCEVVAGAGKLTSGIHLVTDEISVLVRYVFLLVGGAQVPIAGHIVPAMASGMSALRTGAV